jgi:hypothetical protein
MSPKQCYLVCDRNGNAKHPATPFSSLGGRWRCLTHVPSELVGIKTLEEFDVIYIPYYLL